MTTKAPGIRLTTARVLCDAGGIVLALGAAFGIRFGLGLFAVTEASPPTVGYHVIASSLWLVGLLGTLALDRLYDEDTLFRGGGEISRVVRAVVQAGALLTAFVFVTQSFYVSRAWFTLLLLFSVLFLVIGRTALRRVLESRRNAGRARRPAILVGRSDSWEEWPFEEAHEFDVVARLRPEDFEAYCAEVVERGESRPLDGAAVVLRARDFGHDEFWRILMLSGSLRWSVFVHSPVRSVGRDRLTVRDLAGQTIVKVAPPTLTGARAVQKRSFDVLVSLLLVVVLSPVMATIALGVVLTSGFPILFRQERVGEGGRTFKMLKFRSMRRARGDEPLDDGAWTTEDDPRRTPIGRFLRRSSLDELPQLWNVLMGHMSLVGPRPERPLLVGAFEEELIWYRFRHRIRPGMTGWAQSHGLRGDTPLDPRVQFDNWYIENWSIWLDLKILAMTVREIVKGTNAY